MFSAPTLPGSADSLILGLHTLATGFGSSKQTSLVPVTSAYASQASFCAETNDGILGIGPTGLTRGTLSDTNDTIPTVIDMLFDQGQIDDPVIGVCESDVYLGTA